MVRAVLEGPQLISDRMSLSESCRMQNLEARRHVKEKVVISVCKGCRK